MIGFGLKAFPVFSDRLIGAVWTFYVLSMFCHKPAKPLLDPSQVNRGMTCFVCQGHFINICSTSHQHMFYVPSTYVLCPINICSTSHQHMFCASLTYVQLSSTYVLRLINVSSTSHLRYIYEGSTLHRRLIYEGSTSHLRGIYVSSTSHRRGILKRNESVFRLSPNQVVLAAFSCTKQVYGKPKQLA